MWSNRLVDCANTPRLSRISQDICKLNDMCGDRNIFGNVSTAADIYPLPPNMKDRGTISAKTKWKWGNQATCVPAVTLNIPWPELAKWLHIQQGYAYRNDCKWTQQIGNFFFELWQARYEGNTFAEYLNSIQ